MSESDCFLLLNDPIKISESSDVELSTSISNIFSMIPTNLPQQQMRSPSLTSFPTITIETVLALIKRFAAEDQDGHLSPQQQNDASVSFFCLEQLKVLIATYFSAAAKYAGNLSLVDSWFISNSNNNNDDSKEEFISTTLNTIVSLLLRTLSQESHSLVSGEMLRLFLQCSPTFLRAFVLYSNSSTETKKPLFEETSLGIIAPMLTDNSALKNHSAWEVIFAILENDINTARPSRFVVEYLSKNHLHSFLNVLISCLRHANPASRRFTLRFISDMSKAFGEWSPISHCVLQSPAIFYALLANAEGPACPEHWQVYHIIKMFITFPNKCPLMRHLCYINRDALGQYAQSCATKFSVHAGETTTIMAKLAAMTPLTAEEAALIQVGL